jgi:hypothetical protein
MLNYVFLFTVLAHCCIHTSDILFNPVSFVPLQVFSGFVIANLADRFSRSLGLS